MKSHDVLFPGILYDLYNEYELPTAKIAAYSIGHF